jgi:hypothetical protein
LLNLDPSEDNGTASQGRIAMTARCLFWLGFLACLSLAFFVGVRLLTPRHRIGYENYQKIKIGMALAEVEALLGVPAGDYSTRPVVFYRVGRAERPHRWEKNG